MATVYGRLSDTEGAPGAGGADFASGNDTLFLYGTGISDSNTHFHDDLPIAIVGGKAAGIKGGRYIRYPKGTPLTNMHLTILENMGVHPESIGDSTGKLARLTDV